MPDSGSGLRLGSLRVGANREFGFGRRDSEAVTSQVWVGAGKSLIKVASLGERLKVSVRSACRFHLSFSSRDGAQRLDRGTLVGGAHRLRIDTQPSR